MGVGSSRCKGMKYAADRGRRAQLAMRSQSGYANAASYAMVESPVGGARAAVGMASRIRRAMS